MTGIEFPILWWNPEQSGLSNLGIRPELKETDNRIVMFYNIDNVSTYYENDEEYCSIQSGGSEYISTVKYVDVCEKLKYWNK